MTRGYDAGPRAARFLDLLDAAPGGHLAPVRALSSAVGTRVQPVAPRDPGHTAGTGARLALRGTS